MSSAKYGEIALFEHRFWLRILGDHCTFILNSLSPEETDEIQRAQMFKGIFDSLLGEAHGSPSDKELRKLNSEAYENAAKLRDFKLHLLTRHITGKIAIHLPPTFFNHMLNELEEYMRVLCPLLSDGTPEMPPVHYHLLWLLDGAGHAASICGSLDEVETELREKSREFNGNFKDLYIKAIEMAGYMRTGEDEFPALLRFNKQVEYRMKKFMKFLKEIEEMVMDKRVLSTLMAIIPDHMHREECYYLTKLSQVSHVEAPDCDPL